MTDAEPRRTAITAIRFDPAELAQIKAAAAKKGVRQSTWIRETLIRAAKRETAK